MQVKIREKGQMTIPKEVRDEIGLEIGESLTVMVIDGEIRMRPTKGVVERTFGVFRHLAEANKGKSIEQILSEEEAAIERGMLEDFLQSENRR